MIKVNISNHIVCDSSEAAEPRDAHNPCVGLSNQTHGLPNICGTLVPIACELGLLFDLNVQYWQDQFKYLSHRPVLLVLYYPHVEAKKGTPITMGNI